MKRLLTVLLCAVLIITLSACSQNDAATPDQAVKTADVQTPYVTLKIPEIYKQDLSIEVVSEDPYSVLFSVKATGDEILTVTFSEERGNLLGTLVLDEENVSVYADIPEIATADETYEKYSEYQDMVLNTIISHLITEYDFAVNELVDRTDESTYEIETSYMTLVYPSKWKEKISVSNKEDTIRFSSQDVPLFDITFGESDGHIIGEYKDTPVYVTTYEIKEDGLDDSRISELYAMQDDLNITIQNMKNDPSFIPET